MMLQLGLNRRLFEPESRKDWDETAAFLVAQWLREGMKVGCAAPLPLSVSGKRILLASLRRV